MQNISRRTVIGTVLYATGLTAIGGLSACGLSKPKTSLLENIGDLGPPDKNGVRLPEGFTSRIVARSGETVIGTSDYIWHGAPDGAAIFATKSGGWIYTSNSELRDAKGGVGALVFNASGEVIDAYPILTGTTRNCAGGATPWGTWLSCEETHTGLVWECDPWGKRPAIKRPSLGIFNHEAVAVNPDTNILYLTEDRGAGLFYRFIPEKISKARIPDLTSGKLQAATVDPVTNAVTWSDVPDPLGTNQPTHLQIPHATPFKGGEGIVYYDNVVSFVTKGDNRIWAYQTDNEIMSVIYDHATSDNPILSGVDNMTLSQDGELLISEDGGDMQIIAVTATGRLLPLLQIVGHDDSEVTGPAFSPDGTRLYFSSQRGADKSSMGGMTFEVTGPFHG